MSLNQKISGIFPQDSIVPKSFSLSKNSAKYENIIHHRVFQVPVGVLANPLKIISVQSNVEGVKFYKFGMMINAQSHNRLMNLLLNSVKFN